MESGDALHLVSDVLRTLGDRGHLEPFDEADNAAEQLERLSVEPLTSGVVISYLELGSRLVRHRECLAEAEACTGIALSKATELKVEDLTVAAAILRSRHCSNIGDFVSAIAVLTEPLRRGRESSLSPSIGSQLWEQRAQVLFDLQLYRDACDCFNQARRVADLSAEAAVVFAASQLLLTGPLGADELLAAAVARADSEKDDASRLNGRFWLGIAALLGGDLPRVRDICVQLRVISDPQNYNDRAQLLAELLEGVLLSRSSDEISAIAKLVAVRHRSKALWPRLRWLQESFRLSITETAGPVARREYVNQIDVDERDYRALQVVARDPARLPSQSISYIETKDVLLRDRLERDVAKTLDSLWESAVSAEAREDETGEHPVRVGRLTRLLAVRVGKDEAFCRDVEKAAAWHDLGKLSIPNHIILKRSRLKPEQITAMQEHTKHGAQLLSEQPFEHSAIRMAVSVARFHHERWDGHGYPDSLKGEAIPEAARMTSLAEVFDALTHKRPWRGAMSAPDAIELIIANRGSQFDPYLADEFVGLVRDLVMAHGTDLDAFLVQGSHASALVELRKDILRRSA